MNCGMTQFWNGAAGVMLVLRICVHLGTKQLSVQGWATICDRRKKKKQSLKESPRQNQTMAKYLEMFECVLFLCNYLRAKIYIQLQSHDFGVQRLKMILVCSQGPWVRKLTNNSHQDLQRVNPTGLKLLYTPAKREGAVILRMEEEFSRKKMSFFSLGKPSLCL